MANAKVTLNGVTLIDLTSDTVASDNLLNGYIAHRSDGEIITGTYVPASVSLISGSADPTESSQHITPPSGYDGFEYFDVGAISSDYVGSNIPARSSSDLTVSGATVSVPSGYYGAATSKAISAGSAITPETIIIADPTLSINNSTGVVTGIVSKIENITPSVTPGYVSSGTAGKVTIDGGNLLALSTQAGTTINPTENEQTAVAAGKYTIGAVKVGAISSNYVGSNIPTRTSTNLTASGSYINVPAGYYAAVASKAVSAGTTGTPIATKGSVSNHSISITPSVTNSTGYITGGTKTGTAVTVQVSELVSGTKTISANGTGIDVTNYASVDVAVPGETPVLETILKNYTPTTSVQTEVITAGTGYDAIGEVDVLVAAIPSKYKDTTDTDAVASQVLSGKKFVNSTGLVTGAMTYQGAFSTTLDATTNNQIVTIPSGYHNGSGIINIVLEEKTTSPAETIKVVTPTNGKVLNKVTVSAISSNYVGSNVPRRTAYHLAAVGSYIEVPYGYYAARVSKSVNAGTAATPSTSITANPTLSINTSTGKITGIVNKSQSITPTVNTGYISNGTAGTVSINGSSSLTLSTQSATTIIPTTSSQMAVNSGVYTTGKITVSAIPSQYIVTTDATATASDILYNKTAYVNGSKITGTFELARVNDTTLILNNTNSSVNGTTLII